MIGAERRPFILLRSNGEGVWNRSDPAILPNRISRWGQQGARAWDKDHSMEDAIETLHREGTISHHVDDRGA